jgi:hypothetical protein
VASGEGEAAAASVEVEVALGDGAASEGGLEPSVGVVDEDDAVGAGCASVVVVAETTTGFLGSEL